MKQTTINIYVDDLRRLHLHKQPRLIRKKQQNYFETLSEVLGRAISALEKEEEDRWIKRSL